MAIVDTAPGDIVVRNHNLKHASFGGGKVRRMFTATDVHHEHL